MAAQYLGESELLQSRLLGMGRSSRRDDGLAGVKLGHPGRCPSEPTLHISVFDNSGSTTGANDPIGNRFIEARYALDAVARRCHCRTELGAVVHFDTPTSLDVPPTPIRRHGRKIMARGLAIPPDGAGSSELRPSLRRACKLAGAHPDHHAMLAVYSDFELFDRPSVADVLSELGDFPGVVHAVVLRADPPAELLDDPRVQVSRIAPDDPPGAVAHVMFDSLTTFRARRRLVANYSGQQEA